MKTRLAAVFSHPIQYFAPLFQVLARDAELDFKVFYCTHWGMDDHLDPGFGKRVRWDIPLLDGYEWELLPARKPVREMTFLSVDNPGIGSRLEDFRADVVWIHGYAHATNLRALWWGRRHGVILTGDSELLHQRSAAKRLAKKVILPRLFKRVDVFVDYGERNREYYRHYGVSDTRMVPGGYPLDVARFHRARTGFTPQLRSELQARYGLAPQVLTVLWAGKFIPAKRPLDLIRAIALVKASKRDVQVLFVGSGPLQGEMERLIAAEGLGGRVKLAGFVNQAEMPRVLCLGDLLAMTSEKEPYGLAIPEAMAVGNAIVASDRVGCVSDSGVARPGVNTLVYPCGDVPALAAAIAALASEPDRLAGMQRESGKLAWQQDCAVVATAVREAAHRAHQRHLPSRPCAA